jgi:outer membrane lipoprotein-sorting protein
MNCRDLEELLSAYADGELSRTQREFIEEHLSDCADCRATLAQFETAGRQLASLRKTPASPDISKSTLSKIKAVGINAPKDWRRWLRPVMAAAAIVAVIAIMLVAQPWNLESSEAMAASIARDSPEVQAALNGEDIEEVEVTTKIVDEENNVLMVLVRTEERAVAAQVNLETKQVTEIVRVEVPDFQPGDEQKAIDIAGADPRVQDIFAKGGTISEVHLGYSLAGETVIPNALLTIKQDKYDWNISVDLQKGEVASIGRSQPSAAMTVVYISRFVTRFVAPVLLVLGILLVSGLAFGYRRARTIAGTAALTLGIIGLFMALYSLSSIWWRLILSVGIPAAGLVIGIAAIKQRTGRRWLPVTGIALGSLALLLVFLNAIMLNLNNVPGESVVRVIGMAVVIAGIIAYAFKEQIMRIHISGRWLRPAMVALAAVVVLVIALVQPWNVSPQSVIAKAYSATEGLLSYRMSSTFTSTSEGETFEQTSEWEFAAPDRWHHIFTMDGREYEIISVGDSIYINDPADARLTVESWSPTVPSKEETLEVLASLTDLKKLPDELIEDTDCLHYSGKVDMEKRIGEIKSRLDPNDAGYEDALKQVEEIQNISTIIELWIGKEDYLIRKWQQESRLAGVVKENSTRIYYDFNQPITIEPPLTAEGKPFPGWRLQETIPLSTMPAGEAPRPTSIPPSEEETAPYLEARRKVDFPIGMPRYIPDEMVLENVDIMETPTVAKMVRFLYGKKSISQHIRLTQSRFNPEDKAERDAAFEKAGFTEVKIKGVAGYWRQGVLCQTDIDDPSTQYWDMEQIEIWWDTGETSYTITAKNVTLDELLYLANSILKID